MDEVAGHLGLTVLRQLDGGEFGAFLARTARGQRVVLKVLAPHPRLSIDYVRNAVDLADALRDDGYPIPRIEPAAAALLAETAAAEVPHRVRGALVALGALQRLTFAVRTRPQALEWALATAEDLPALAADGM